MARTPSQIRQLKNLLDRADALARVVTASWRRTVREIRKEVAYMTGELNVGRNAANRERVIRQVQYHINRLGRRIDRLENAHLEFVFDDPIPRGNYPTAIYTRSGKGTDYKTIRVCREAKAI